MKRIFACLFITAVLPLIASTTQINSTRSVPFTTVAYAGHSLVGGGWCDCGAAGCMCDAGEQSGGHSAKTVSDQNERSSKQGATSARAGGTFDFGSSALMLALAFFLWTRLRS